MIETGLKKRFFKKMKKKFDREAGAVILNFVLSVESTERQHRLRRQKTLRGHARRSLCEGGVEIKTAKTVKKKLDIINKHSTLRNVR